MTVLLLYSSLVLRTGVSSLIKTIIHYNMVKPNLKGPADLLRFIDSFGLKKAKIKERKILDLIYLSVHLIDSV